MSWIHIADVRDLPLGATRCVVFEGRRLALFNLGGVLHALDDLCSHMGGPLSSGRRDGVHVICPWHGARFDITSGKVLSPPAGRDVRRYKVKIEDNAILVAID